MSKRTEQNCDPVYIKHVPKELIAKLEIEAERRRVTKNTLLVEIALKHFGLSNILN